MRVKRRATDKVWEKRTIAVWTIVKTIRVCARPRLYAEKTRLHKMPSMNVHSFTARRRHLFFGAPRRAALLALLLVLCAARPAGAAETTALASGVLPKTGTVVIRSGLAWLDENSLLFRVAGAALEKELAARGLSVVAVSPGKPEPLPQTPLPPQKRFPPPSPTSARDKAVSGSQAARKAEELGKEGKLPQLRLRGYTLPERDEDLPPNVKSVSPPDAARALFARSQQADAPVTTSFSIPGRIPEELKADAQIANYALIVRFATVRSLGSAPSNDMFLHGHFGVLVAASSIQGVGRLGFGAPAAPSPPGRSSYGTPGGYVRGYESPSGIGDFWGRDRDFFQRDYQFKHGPEPSRATPPKDFSPSRRATSGAPSSSLGRAAFATRGWNLLLLDGFDLAPTRKGKTPEQIWHAAARTLDDEEDLKTALPKLVRAAIAAAGK